MVIRRVNPLSCAKIGGGLYAIMGLVAGLVFLAFGSFMAAAGLGSDESSGIPFAGALFGVAGVIVLPLVYGILGAVLSLISAVVYNLVAGITGGLEVEVEPTSPGGGQVLN